MFSGAVFSADFLEVTFARCQCTRGCRDLFEDRGKESGATGADKAVILNDLQDMAQVTVGQ